MLPIVVLVMILQDQRHGTRRRMRQALLDRICREIQSLFARQLRPPLAAKNPAILSTERRTQIDPTLLQIDLLLSKGSIRMREVRRRTQHRNLEPLVGRNLAKLLRRTRLLQLQEANVEFESI